MKPNRKLIRKNETEVSWLQIVGFCLILFGVIYLFINLFWYEVNAADISINFFIIMLGFAFAFPDLLQDQNCGLSTMRIIVFMMTNVICMLLLKIGWGNNINSLKDIGLDQWWMGVIAFIFGAKATQSYFESKMWENQNIPITNTGSTLSQPQNSTLNPQSYSNDVIVQMAIKQFSIKHLDGVVGVGRAFNIVKGGRQSCLQINVNDEKYIDVYTKPLNVDLGNGNTQSITPKVFFVGTPKTHGGQAGAGIINVGGSNGEGTLGCIVIDNDTKKKHILSCQHVLNHDNNYDDISNPTSIAFVNNLSSIIARHVSGERTHEIDAGLAELINQNGFDNSNLGQIKGTRNLSVSDTNETIKVSLTGFNIHNSKIQKNEGLIVNNEFYAELKYPGEAQSFGIDDLIVLSSKNGDSYTAISEPGYSGALVLDSSNYVIGLLIGGDDNYSYAIPINKILTAFNCSII